MPDFIKKQKEDVEELAAMFKSMLGKETKDTDSKYIKALENHFTPQADFAANYMIIIDDLRKNLLVKVSEDKLQCYFGPQEEDIDVIAKISSDGLDKIIHGHQTFQGAFMGGSMTAKGNFRILKALDQVFTF